MKEIDNSKAIQILEENGFEVIQYCAADGEVLTNDLIVFRADVCGCIRAHQILNNEGFGITDCNLQLNIRDGVLEKPHGQITFYRH